MKLEFSKNIQITNFMKIRPVGAELFHAETDKHDEANSRFLQFCERAQKRITKLTIRRTVIY